MFNVPPADRYRLAQLFQIHHRWRPMIDSIIEGQFGSADSDSIENPEIAQLTLGLFAFYAGSPKHPLAIDLVRNATRLPFEGRWIEFIDPAWGDLFKDIHGEKKFKGHLTRFDMASDTLDLGILEKLASAHRDGFKVLRLDESTVMRAGGEVDSALIHSFQSAKDFMARGFGCCAIEESTGRIASAATTYAVAKRGVEIEIDTHPDFRRKGLAAILGASLILKTIRRGLDPHWDAISKESEALAIKLGYRPLGSYEACWLDPEGY